jgi:hypothetical protein
VNPAQMTPAELLRCAAEAMSRAEALPPGSPAQETWLFLFDGYWDEIDRRIIAASGAS